MENKDKENDKMSEEVITNDATKDGANAAANKIGRASCRERV